MCFYEKIYVSLSLIKEHEFKKNESFGKIQMIPSVLFSC